MEIGGTNRVFFTPDSQALVTSRGEEYCFWEVGTWQPGRRLRREMTPYPGCLAFSPDRKVLAVELSSGIIDLVNAGSGKTLARLEDPNHDRPGWMGFTPDGTRLVTIANYSKAIHVWDLRRIRERLAEMDLDWDLGSYPLPRDSDAVKPLRIQVDLGDPAQLLRDREGTTRQLIERYRRALEANPNNAGACNHLAWIYLTGPEALRDVKAALPLAEKAVRLAPGNALFGNTLGVAYYRAGRYREAVDVLRSNLGSQEDWALAFDLYFLAMSHHRLGETTRGRDYYDWGVRWTRAQPGLSAAHLEELNVFRAEAEELLKPKSAVKTQESAKSESQKKD